MTFANVLSGLPTAYYDPKRLPPRRAFLSALARLERAAPEVVVFPPDVRGVVRMLAKGRERRLQTDDIKTWMQMGDRLLDILRWVDLALGDPSRRDELQYAAIKGCLQELDPHTVFFTAEEYAKQQSRFTGSMVGVGVLLGTLQGRIVVREVVPKGPADRAGVRPGDALLQVGALQLANLSPKVAAGRLRGAVGTRVTLVVERAGRRLTFTVTRAEIELPSVEARLLPGRVALVRISGFPKNALAVFEKAIAPLQRQRPVAWVLDLRGNEGGYILQAARMADHFLSKGLICKAVGRGGQKVVTWEVKPRPDRLEAPVVVLVNRGTASAAEILAGTLSVNGRALLLGERTWGKGTVQKLFHMPDKSVLKLTMWQYLLAGDIPIQTAALVPDVELIRVRIAKDRVSYRTAGRAQNEASQTHRIDAMAGKQAWKGRPVVPPVHYSAAAPSANAGEAASPEAADPALELARQIAVAAKGEGRDALLAAATPLVQGFRVAQARLIHERLKAVGVDWRPAPAKAAAPVLSATLVADPITPRAGQKVTLSLTVENNGQVPAYRVGATLGAFYDRMDGRELLFGHVAPGQKRTQRLEIPLPAGLRARWELVRARIQVAGRKDLTEAQTVLRITEQPRPRFQLSWLVDDRKGGNGDGRLAPGERAALRLWVKNLGPGTAEAARVDAVDPTGGLIVSRARAVLPNLAPQGTAQAALEIALPAARPGRARRGRAGFTMTVYDQELGGDLEVRVLVPPASRGLDFAPTRRLVAPKSRDVYLSAFAGPDAPRVGYVRERTHLTVEAFSGRWLRVTLPEGRFSFLTKDDVKPTQGAPNAAGYAPTWHATPPAVTLATVPGVAVDADLEVSGQAATLRGVQDLWVRVWNPESGHKDVDKVLYQAAPPGGSRQLAFKARVPLRPGTNYVVVDARDVAGLEGQVRAAVYRPPEADRTTPRPPPRTPAAEPAEDAPAPPAKKKSGCGCAAGSGPGADPGALPGLLLALLALVRLRRRVAPRAGVR